MSIFDKLSVKPTGKLHAPVTPSPCIYEENVEHRPNQFSANIREEYEYGFHFKVLFNCRPEEYNHHLQRARDMVSMELYGDAINTLYKIDYMIMNYDIQRASELLRSLVLSLKGE